MSSESEFNGLADRVFALIGDALDACDGDFDWTLSEGVLEIECPDSSKLILSRHTATRQLWLAARSGGYHYRAEQGDWCDTRGGEPLRLRLERELREQGGAAVGLPALPA